MTEEQKKSVEKSMNQAREESDELNAEYFPRMQQIISNSYAEIFGQLTPEQKEILEAKKEKMQKRWKERRRRSRRRRNGTNTTHRSSRHRQRPPGAPARKEGETGGTGTIEKATQP